MIVVRYTWQNIPASHFEEARKLWMEIGPPESSVLRGVRDYLSKTGPGNTLALEWEFDSLADWEAFLSQFAAVPEYADKFRRWDELVPNAATIEIWDLLESD